MSFTPAFPVAHDLHAFSACFLPLLLSFLSLLSFSLSFFLRWNFQFPSCLSLKKDEGLNIECITIAAGVPGPDKCAEICDAMLEVGIARLGFKPGTAGAIANVVDIAHRNPRMTIVLQWTGGRSGGHHSQVS